jgi:NADH-quinone oxidoreductase subunit L
VGGWIEVPGGWSAVDTFLDPVAAPLLEPEAWMEAMSPILSVCVALAGIWLAWRLYGVPSDAPARLRRRYPAATATLERKFYFDEAYDAAFYEPSSRLALFLDRAIEGPLILGSVGSLARSIGALGRRVAATQTGLLRSYALALAAGAAVIVLVFISVR